MQSQYGLTRRWDNDQCPIRISLYATMGAFLGILISRPLVSIVQGSHDYRQYRQRFSHSHFIGENAATHLVWTLLVLVAADLMDEPTRVLVEIQEVLFCYYKPIFACDLGRFPKSELVRNFSRFPLMHESKTLFLVPDFALNMSSKSRKLRLTLASLFLVFGLPRPAGDPQHGGAIAGPRPRHLEPSRPEYALQSLRYSVAYHLFDQSVQCRQI